MGLPYNRAMSTPTYNWPFPYPARPNQVKAMDWLLSQNAKYLILEAPVGSGKSNIGLAYSSYLSADGNGDSFILTPQRILQEQYETSFRDNVKTPLFSLYGKSNYECRTKKVSCEIGSLVKPRCTNCAHAVAKAVAKRTANTVMNYKLALLMFGYTQTFDEHNRNLMILDECHTLEQHLVDFDAVALTYARAKKYDVPWQVYTTIESARKWVIDSYLPAIKAVHKKMETEVEYMIDKDGGQLTSSELRKLKDFNALSSHVDEVTEISIQPLDYLEQHYVLVHDKISMSFKRLKGAFTFRRILDPRADRILFMSSTVLNKNGFCYDLGIDPKDAAFLSLDSEFPVENRPVIYMPQMKMNATWKEETSTRIKERSLMIKTVRQLLEAHGTESGLIHTANFQIAQWLVENLNGEIPHRIYHHNPNSGDDRNSVINGFMADPKPSVLISPSSTEGLDLKDDLGRFAIFVKVPFGFLGDQWIKKRMEMSSEWYQRRALIDVIQGGGRVVRGPEDKGNVYILDASWAYLYKQTYGMIPKWWREGYQTIA